jgi:enoyl-CoA hydratase/carnithine racemase
MEWEQRGNLAIDTTNRADRQPATGLEWATDLANSRQEFERVENARLANPTGAGRGFCVGMEVVEWAECGQSGPRLPPVAESDHFWT